MSNHKFSPDYAVPPGATLKETLEMKGLSQSDLCIRTGLAEKTVSQIINGIAPISYETAEKLELVTGIPANFWNKRELAYREPIVREQENTKLIADKAWLKEIPMSVLLDREFIEDSTSVREALRFFGVSNVEAWRRTWTDPAVQYRGRKSQQKYPGFVAAWLRMGELKAREIECAEFDAKEFKSALTSVRSLTNEPAKSWPSRLRDICAPAGVAVVFTREIPRAGVSGVARWLSKDKALIQVSLKFKSDDQLWYSFFHEAGHILLHGKRQMFLEFGRHDDTQEEQEANLFSRNILIPREYERQLARLKKKVDIRAFARQLGISPGIVVGRLQFDEILPRSHCNDLKRKLVWGKS